MSLTNFPAFTFEKDGVFHFSRRNPAELICYYSSSRIVYSLRTRSVRVANLSVINAILFVAENGCKWRALPPRFGKWHTVYIRMRRWADAGVSDRLFDALQEHHMISVSVGCPGLGSTSVKVHPDGTGAPKKTARKPLANRGAAGTQKSI